MKATYVQIDLAAIRHNLSYIHRLHPQVQIIAVVKADAYGHGMVSIGHAALEGGASMLAVAFSEEGVRLRAEGITAPVLILGATPDSNADQVVSYGLIQTVFDADGVRALERAAQLQNTTVQAHLKIETGMHRIGARPGKEMEAVLRALEDCPRVKLTGAFSHLAMADDPSGTYNRYQEEIFRQGIAQLREAGYDHLLVHLANSGMAVGQGPVPYDALRFGIALYGLSPLPTPIPELQPVLSWHTQVSYVKDVYPGECIGYGCTYTAEKLMRVATLPVGYADGYRRCLAGKGYVLIHGEKAPLVGRICMDQCMVDVTAIPDVKKGDPVVLIGRQGEQTISADLVAQWMDTIHYEVLTGIGHRVPRFYHDA